MWKVAQIVLHEKWHDFGKKFTLSLRFFQISFKHSNWISQSQMMKTLAQLFLVCFWSWFFFIGADFVSLKLFPRFFLSFLPCLLINLGMIHNSFELIHCVFFYLQKKMKIRKKGLKSRNKVDKDYQREWHWYELIIKEFHKEYY